MAECFEHGFDNERHQQEKSYARQHGKGKKPRTDKAPNSTARFRFHSPDRIERVLKLTEYPGCPEKGDDQSKRGCQAASARRGRTLLSDVLHHLDGAAVEEIAHLFGDFAPYAGR